MSKAGHLWGYPGDEERKLVEAMERNHRHRELWCGAWHCVECKTIFCEHCSLEAAIRDGCAGPTSKGWAVQLTEVIAMNDRR